MNESTTQSSNLLDKRKERMVKLFRRQETDKVPFMMFAENYLPFYAGVELKEITSYDYAVKIHKQVMDDLQPDSTYYYIPNNLIWASKFSLLEGGAHVISDDCVKQINPAATCIMEAEEYPKLIQDPLNYLLETVYPRRFQLLAEDNAEKKYNNLAKLMGDVFELITYLMNCEKESQVPNIALLYYFNPIDIILDVLRNFTGMISDVRRCPELVRDAGLAMVEDIAKIMSLTPPEEHNTIMCPMHLPSFIKPKDFEKVYWPSYKKLTELLVAQGHNVTFLFEKNYSHLYDYLQDLPKQQVGGVFNEDDIRVVQKKLGNHMTIFGGLSLNVLSYGTKQESIDHIKKLIDDVGREPGFCIAPDMPMEHRADGKPENLKAVADTILTYGMN